MTLLQVEPDPAYPAARITCGHHSFAAVVGRSGVTLDKREGDGATPVGLLPVRAIWARTDRLTVKRSTLPVRRIQRDDAWCDDPESPQYNTPIKQPDPTVGDRLWRDDHLYDLLIVLGYNDDPPVAHRGSAIFLHVARKESDPGCTPTDGCIAVARQDLLTIVGSLDATSAAKILPSRRGNPVPIKGSEP